MANGGKTHLLVNERQPIDYNKSHICDYNRLMVVCIGCHSIYHFSP